jgi:hypothetical protein
MVSLEGIMLRLHWGLVEAVPSDRPHANSQTARLDGNAVLL